MIDTLKTSDFLTSSLPRTGVELSGLAPVQSEFKPSISFADMLAASSGKVSSINEKQPEEPAKPEEITEQDSEHDDEADAGGVQIVVSAERGAGAAESMLVVNGEQTAAAPETKAETTELASVSELESLQNGNNALHNAVTESGGKELESIAGQHETFAGEVSQALMQKGETAEADPNALQTVKAEGLEAEQYLDNMSSLAAEESDAEGSAHAEQRNAKSSPLSPNQETAALHGERRAADSKQNFDTKDQGGAANGKNPRREKAVKVEVRDMRTAGTGGETNEISRQASTNSGKETEIIVEVKSAPASAASDQAEPSSFLFRAEKSLENFLARELHQNLNGDIVRHAQLMLKNGGEGTIRLALRPESLGNVKIHLEMADNKVKGTIVVESAEALRAFEREISSMQEAFLDSGFEGASLEMTLAGGGENSGAEHEAAETFRTLNAGYSAARYDESIEMVDEGGSFLRPSYAGNSVDFLV